MLRMKKAIVICREVNRQTGQIAVYVVPMEIDEHTVVRLTCGQCSTRSCAISLCMKMSTKNRNRKSPPC